MNFDNHTYDAIGAKMVEELFKELEQIAPIDDDCTPPKKSVIKRLIAFVKRETALPDSAPCGDEVPAHSSF